MIGAGKEFQNLPFMHLSVNEIDLEFQYQYKNTWPKSNSIGFGWFDRFETFGYALVSIGGGSQGI
jgi:hypothetical protein